MSSAYVYALSKANSHSLGTSPLCEAVSVFSSSTSSSAVSSSAASSAGSLSMEDNSFSKSETWFTSVCFSSLTSLFPSFRVSISDWRDSFSSFIFSISSSRSSLTPSFPSCVFCSSFSFFNLSPSSSCLSLFSVISFPYFLYLLRQLPLQAGQFVLTVHLMIQHQIPPPRRMHQEPVPSQN